MSATHFMVRKNALDKRWDAFYYEPEIVALERRVQQKATHTLRDFVRFMSGGATPLKSESDLHYTDAANGVPFIRVQNLTSTGELDLQDVKHITHSTNNSSLARSRLSGGELLVKITGVGRMAVASVVPDGLEANINQHIAAIKTDSKAQSEALAAYLNLDFVERLATRRATGGTRPALDYNALLSIPIIDDQRIVSIMQDAYAEKKQLEVQAAELLADVDSVLYRHLGIELHQQDKQQLPQRIFRKRTHEISNARWDAFFHKPNFLENLEAINTSKFSIRPLHEVVVGKLIKGTLPKEEEKGGQSRVVQINSLNADGSFDLFSLLLAAPIFENNQKLQTNDILIVITGATIGKIGLWKAGGDYWLGGDIVKLSTNAASVPEYVFSWLRSELLQRELKRRVTGATNGHLSPMDILSLPIPLPPLATQQKIANEIASLRNDSVALSATAKLKIQQAKKTVEKLILGEA